MAEETLINLYSLYIQASGIFIALVGVYAFFRLEKVAELLIGQGSAVFKSQNDIKDGKIDGATLSDKYHRRLRDAIDRKNIYGVKESLIRLAISEDKNGSKNEFANLRHILPKYIKTLEYRDKIKSKSFLGISFFAATIILSIASIIATEAFYQHYYEASITIFGIISLIFLLSLGITGYLIYISNFSLVGFEKKKQDVCRTLKNENPIIEELY